MKKIKKISKWKPIWNFCLNSEIPNNKNIIKDKLVLHAPNVYARATKYKLAHTSKIL